MTSGMRTVIYPVKGIEKAKAVYSSLLGADPVMDGRTTWDTGSAIRTWVSTRTGMHRA